ncbi:hypothetical protein WBG06_21670 [Nocardioides sp. CCNWLW239]|uniref:hypothetical protein n=1 Tax=Nocardioides sp. CCNWLW239 TaxID=3128902 RepID=UPI003019432A
MTTASGGQDVRVLPRATTREEWLTYLGCAVLFTVLSAWIAFDSVENGSAGLNSPENERTLGVVFAAVGLSAVAYILVRLRTGEAATAPTQSASDGRHT